MPSLETPCFYRQNDGTYCKGGYLVKDRMLSETHTVQTIVTEPITIEDTVIKCLVCDDGAIITKEGQEVLAFMRKHLAPILAEMIHAALEAEI